MEANEFMVDDWVYNTHNKQNEQVVEVGSNCVMLAYNDLYAFDEIEPVPLTPEILEKNGFTKHAYGFSFQYLKLNGNLRNDDTVYFTITISGKDITIDYVHQLQHALRLCGIEKEITL